MGHKWAKSNEPLLVKKLWSLVFQFGLEMLSESEMGLYVFLYFLINHCIVAYVGFLSSIDVLLLYQLEAAAGINIY